MAAHSSLESPHGQWSLVGCSPRGDKELDTTERLSTLTKLETYSDFSILSGDLFHVYFFKILSHIHILVRKQCYITAKRLPHVPPLQLDSLQL